MGYSAPDWIPGQARNDAVGWRRARNEHRRQQHVLPSMLTAFAGRQGWWSDSVFWIPGQARNDVGLGLGGGL